MCLDILRNPAKAIMEAKKKNNMNHTLKVLLETSIIFGLAAGVVVARTGIYDALLIGSIVSVFLMALIGMMLFGLVAYLSTTTLGGKGKYFEGLTATTYGMLPISMGIFAVSLLAWAPFTLGVQIIVLAVTFALGISVLFRGLKELYKIDMVTSFVSLLISVLVILLAVYVSVGLSLLNRIAMGML